MLVYKLVKYRGIAVNNVEMASIDVGSLAMSQNISS